MQPLCRALVPTQGWPPQPSASSTVFAAFGASHFHATETPAAATLAGRVHSDRIAIILFRGVDDERFFTTHACRVRSGGLPPARLARGPRAERVS